MTEITRKRVAATDDIPAHYTMWNGDTFLGVARHFTGGSFIWIDAKIESPAKHFPRMLNLEKYLESKVTPTADLIAKFKVDLSQYGCLQTSDTT